MLESRAVLRLALPGKDAVASWDRGCHDGAEADRWLAEAERLGVFPSVAKRVRPDHPRLREITARNLWLKSEQKQLLERLAAAGICAHGVKGVELAERLYPDLSWREIEDVDLLVEKEQAVAAFAILRSAGCVPNHEWTPAGLRRQLARSLRLAPELVFRTGAGLTVELHWDWPAGRLPTADLFDQPEHYLVYLCRHAGKHFWSHVKWSCDIELLVRRYWAQFDWPLFWRVAAASGAERSCAASLELCRQWFNGTAPPGLEQQLRRSAKRLAAQAAGEIFNPAASPSHPVWTKLRLASWRDRPAMLREWMAPQPQEWNRAEGRGWPRWRVWMRRVEHLWRRWAPHRVRQLTAADWAVLAEAYWTVGVVEAGRRMLPFPRLVRLAGGPNQVVSGGPWDLEKLHRVAWLVEVAANRQPVQIRCLTRSVALARMLRRRGVAAELRLGVKSAGGQIDAHAWVEWQGRVVHDPEAQSGAYVELQGA